ncbi:Gfo/Idh/MocA family oxidoreductase [candidate division KSB1 bacterium]|nr:Gfo/Idh/MocA family oxidoreductase [candidate division KSB1 bacterium]MBL7093911.1 Gfo/Idh/MocA family oxidoreductase [candidate division KSB1 bacterium]
MNQVKVLIIGAGNRGQTYANYILRHHELAKVVGVAEPRQFHREKIVQSHNIPEQNIFDDWKEVVTRDKFADAVIIATQDNIHAEPAIAFAEKGYHILLEKPMATTEEECRLIIEAVERNKIYFSVCHVLRYTPFTQRLKAIIDSGTIGEIVNIQHLEPVGYWHQAHSFVRGNWRKEDESSFMLMTKSCHDLDWIRYIMVTHCRFVSSFGSLNHFRKEKKPTNASKRCLDCAAEPECPYSAKKVYLRFAEKNHKSWPVDILTSDTTVKGVTEALRTGPYGRCVYECDNDVVDNQVVIMQFEGNKTASFTMTGFNKMAFRKTIIFGTKGELYGDGKVIKHYDFLTEKTETIKVDITDNPLLAGHGGGDDGLMNNFLTAILKDDPNLILSDPQDTLDSYLMVFGAELSRRNKEVVDL